MKTTQCDICKACCPDVGFSRKMVRQFSIKQYFYDSQGGCWEKLHICDECFHTFSLKMQKIMKDRGFIK